MTTRFYQNATRLANRKLTQYGAPATLTRITKTYDASTGRNVVTELKGGVRLLQMDVEETLHAFGTIQIRENQQGSWMTDTAGFPPTENDVLIINPGSGQQRWKVDKILPLAPGGTTIIYKVLLSQ